LNRISVIVVVVILTSIIAVFSISTTIVNPIYAQIDKTIAKTSPIQNQSVEILSHKIKGGQFSDSLIGQIQNNFGKNIESVEVIATFYDENGDIVGTDNGYTNPSDLMAGMKAPFELLLDEGTADDTSSYDVTLSWRQPGSFDQKSKVFEFSKQQQVN
jgi:hypothetical protein